MRLLPFVPVLLLASCAEQVTAPKPSTIVFEATQPNAPVPKRDQVAQAAGAPITAPAPAAAAAPAPAPVAAAPAPEKPKRNWLTGKVEEPKTATPPPTQAPTPAAVVTPAQVAAAPAPAPAAAPSGSSIGGPRGSIRRVGPRSGVASQPAPQPPQAQAAQPAQPKKSWWTKKGAEPQPAPQAAPQQPQPAQPQVAQVQPQAAPKKGQGPQPLANPPKVKRNWLTGKIEVQDSSSAAVAQAAPQPSVQQAPQAPQPTANPPKVKRHWLTGKIIEEPQQAVAQQAPAQKAPTPAPTLPQAKRQRPQEVVFQDQAPIPPVPRGGPRLPLPQQDGDGFRTTIEKQGIPKDEDLRSTAPRATSKPGSGDVIAKPPGQ